MSLPTIQPAPARASLTGPDGRPSAEWLRWYQQIQSATAYITANGASITSANSNITANTAAIASANAAIASLQASRTADEGHLSTIDGEISLMNGTLTSTTNRVGMVQMKLSAGVSGTVPLAKLTTGGTNGSLTVTGGLITAIVQPT